MRRPTAEGTSCPSPAGSEKYFASTGDLLIMSWKRFLLFCAVSVATGKAALGQNFQVVLGGF
ncbi:hypothetical protein PISMIDRAFT_657110 [Pisolithus microcarpus 441]|uniref:Uncharacterized protein n=1 Tax=Pisolithus microcarpus 441 TaxID=765257 RepID=A0A0C9YUC5_9AGAM|nr:hypothetical protein PISMIDRAFT_657110 [Pisolithus microcarpus 441]